MLKQRPSQSPQRIETSEPAEMRRTLAKGVEKFCRWKLSTWRRCTRQPSLAGCLWPDHQRLPICQAIFSVGCAGRMSLCSHMDIMKCCGVSKAVVTLPVMSACVWKHLGDARWTPTGIHWVRTSWSVRGRKWERILLWYVIVSIRLQRTWSPMRLASLTLNCQFWQKCHAGWMCRGWEAAMNWLGNCGRSSC